MQTHWMTLAQDCESWRGMVRGPDPETTQRAPAARRVRAQRSNHRYQHHHHQLAHFKPAIAPHNYQQHAGDFNDMEGYVVHRNIDDNSWCGPNFQTGRLPPLLSRQGAARLSLRTSCRGSGTKAVEGSCCIIVGSAKPAPVSGSCWWSLAHFPSKSVLEPPIQT